MPCDKTPRDYAPEPDNPALEGLEGWIIEDVWLEGPRYVRWEPHLQAFKHRRGDLSLRYSYYLKKERGQKQWVPVPSFAYDYTIEDFREEVKKCHAIVIESLLRKFVSP